MKSLGLGELQRLILKHGTADGKPREALPSVTVARFEAPTELSRYVAAPMFSLVVQGTKQIGLGDQLFEYGIGEYLVTSVDLPISAR